MAPQGRYRNEGYVLRAFLSYNSAWEIYFFGNYAVRAFGKFFAEKMPLCVKILEGAVHPKDSVADASRRSTSGCSSDGMDSSRLGIIVPIRKRPCERPYGQEEVRCRRVFPSGLPSRWRPCPQPGCIYMPYFVAVLRAPEES